MSGLQMRYGWLFAIMIGGILIGNSAKPADFDPLQLEAKIPLGDVSGRIDHMAIDLGRGRLFVAELGNNCVGIVDLKARTVIRTLTGLREPQGVGYVTSTDMLYVANAGDGSVRIYRGAEYASAGRIDLTDDADNVRFDQATNQVFIGYGSGGLAIVDPTTQGKDADIPLAAHPEGFQIDTAEGRIFVNLPSARTIAVVDRKAGKQIAAWPNREGGSNFPMALDLEARRVLTVFRRPATLSVFAMSDGAAVASVDSCGDADDVFVDAQRRRVYVSCGDGYIDVFDSQHGYRPIAHIATVSGARTSLFVPEIDRFLLAVRARWGDPAAIWVYRPAP
jgi:DNA-binding beta-propeller fold protein YncE